LERPLAALAAAAGPDTEAGDEVIVDLIFHILEIAIAVAVPLAVGAAAAEWRWKRRA